MFKNLLDYVRILNAGNHFDMPSTVLANLNINIEDSLKSLHPCHGVVPLFRGLIEPVSIGCFWFVRLFSAFSRCDLNTVLAVWGEDTVESGKIGARLGYQRGELCDKVQGLKDDVGRTITVCCFELVTYFAVGRQRQSFFRHRRARDVTTQLFKLVALMSFG